MTFWRRRCRRCWRGGNEVAAHAQIPGAWRRWRKRWRQRWRQEVAQPTTVQSRPACLALYIARSARSIKVCTVSLAERTLSPAENVTCRPGRMVPNGACASPARIRSMQTCAELASVTGSINRNSSPPQRASTSLARRGVGRCLGKRPEHRIPGSVPVLVVDSLEQIDVEQHQTGRVRAAVVAKLLGFQQLRHVTAIEQPGQFVPGCEPQVLGQRGRQRRILIAHLRAHSGQLRGQQGDAEQRHADHQKMHQLHCRRVMRRIGPRLPRHDRAQQRAGHYSHPHRLG